MEILANIVGISAVILFALSFQCKTRRGIVFANVCSRILYVLQYVLLFAFEGIVFDLIGAAATFPAQKKEEGFVKKHKTPILVLIFLSVAAAGVLMYRNILSLMPVLGVTLELIAVWSTREKTIRIVSFFAQPFWLIYNVCNMAYGSAAGNVFTMVSILIALCRFTGKRKEVSHENSR